MTTQTHMMDPDLLDYLVSTTSRESPLLHGLREETARDEMARMQISPEQGQFMSLLIRLTGARKAVEVGTFTGYSSICIAQAMPDDGKLICCDLSEEWTSMARRYWCLAGLAERIDLRLAPALDTLNTLIDEGETGGFDFAFIDADKENYDAYYEACLTLLRPGGLLAIDNVLWGGRVIDSTVQDEGTQAIRALNKKMQQDDRIDFSMVPIGDGLSLAVKR